MQTPTIGRIVHYVLSAQDAQQIEAARKASGTFGNHVQEGTLTTAVIVAVWPGDLCNLKVLLDGPDTFWALSRPRHSEEVKSPCPAFYWTFPPRA